MDMEFSTEPASLSEISNGSSCDVWQKIEVEVENSSRESREDERIEEANAKEDLILNHQNASILSAPTQENYPENFTENLIIRNAKSETSSSTAINSSSDEALEDQDTKVILERRIRSLQEVMTGLREELQREVTLWKNEREELQVVHDRDDNLGLEEAAAAARAAAAAYAAESPLSNDLGEVVDINSEESLRELAILEYEMKLARYQDEFSLSQAEQRYNTRWQLLANAYKHKLMEVERLCNEELEIVRKNANHIQELRKMTTQWYSSENNGGDTVVNLRGMPQNKILSENSPETYYSFRKGDAEVNMI